MMRVNVKQRIKPGYALIGVLAAMILLGTVFFALFRFNHSIELKLYEPLEEENRLRTRAWEHVRGQILEINSQRPAQQVTQKTSVAGEFRAITPERLQIDGILCLKLNNGNSHYYIVPAPVAPGARNR